MRCTSRPPRLTALLITLIAAGQPPFAVAAAPVLTAASLRANQTDAVPAGGAAPVLYTSDPTKPVLLPAFMIAGRPAFALSISGANFVSGATVLFNGVTLTPTSVSATKVVVNVPALLIFKEGAYDVTVFNPAPGAGSNSVVLNVISPSSGVLISQIRPVINGTTAVVSWFTNVPADGQIWYGLTNPPTTSFGSTTLQMFHQMTIPNLTPGTTYYCQVYSSDGYTNQLPSVFTFKIP